MIRCSRQAVRRSAIEKRSWLCKVRLLRVADLGAQRSMWVSLCQGLNGCFCLSGTEPSQTQLRSGFRPSCSLPAVPTLFFSDHIQSKMVLRYCNPLITSSKVKLLPFADEVQMAFADRRISIHLTQIDCSCIPPPCPGLRHHQFHFTRGSTPLR